MPTKTACLNYVAEKPMLDAAEQGFLQVSEHSDTDDFEVEREGEEEIMGQPHGVPKASLNGSMDDAWPEKRELQGTMMKFDWRASAEKRTCCTARDADILASWERD